ncbi:hypothetical protein KAR48_05010 [bacterium]|nr:hypothetical protein [bacterium]
MSSKQNMSASKPAEIDNEWLEKILRLVIKQDNFIVPVRWILRKLGPEVPLSENELTSFFESDNRFQVYTGLDVDEDDGPISQFSISEQEGMGIYQGPKVMLKDRLPDRGQIVSFLINKADQTYDALLRAWDIRPEKNVTVEDQLLEALARAQKLKRELREALDA